MITGTIEKDMLDRNRAEEALSLSERRLAETQELAHIGSWEWDLISDEAIGSAEMLRLLGLQQLRDENRFTIQSFIECLQPEDRGWVRQTLTKAVEERGSIDYENRIVHADGTVRIIRGLGKVVLDEVGEPVRMIGTAQDITERRQAEEALKESEVRFRALIENSSDAITLFGPDGTILYGSPSTTRVLGYTLDEFVGRSAFELINEDDHPFVISRLTESLQKPGVGVDVQARVLHKDGSWRWLDRVFTNLLDEPGVGAIVNNYRDITERKKAEEAMQELSRSTERQVHITNTVLATIGDFTYIFDIDGRFVYTNRALLNLLGLELDEVVGKTFFQLPYPEELAATLQQQIQQVFDTQQALVSETAFTSPAGAEGYYEYIFRPVFAADGTVFQVVGSTRDVTERKRTELALQNSEKRFRSLIENSSDGITVVGADGILTYASDSSQRIVGYVPEEIVGLDPMQFMHPDDQAAVGKLLLELIESPKGSITTEYRVLHKDGSWVWVESTMSNLLAEPAVRALVFNYRDITERKREEQALTASEARYRTLVEHFPNGAVFLLDRELRYVVAGGTGLTVAGLSPQMVMGKTIWDLFPPDVAARNELSLRAALLGETSRVETQYDERTYMVHTLPVTDGQDTIVGGLVMTQDITEQKLVEEARIGRESAEQANRAKSEYLSRMSHELRTPLNAILGFGQLLQMDDRTPEQQESVEHIVKAGRHLLGLINGVLDIARIEEGTLSFSIEPVLVYDLLQETLLLIKPLADRRKIQLNALSAQTEICYVHADRQRLQQILLNLLANAIKYNREGGSVNVAYSEPGDGQDPQTMQLGHSPEKVRITVSDTGPGISPEKLGRLFTPFERAGAEQSDVEGTGLGLAISKSLVEAMGGAIGVESEEGAGSTFWVELAPADEQVTQAEESARATGSIMGDQGKGQNRTILCIEDNLSNIRLIERILAKRPLTRLLTAMQGQVGLDLAFEHQPDLILLDLHLPDMKGDEVLCRLKANPRAASIPVVMLSADANPRRAEELVAGGAVAYLTKPLDVKQLLTVLDKALDEVQAN